jgi:hypothetical protein
MSVISSTVPTSVSVKLTLSPEQVEMLKQVLGQVVKPGKPSKKEKKEKRTGSSPQGVTPGQLDGWINYVKSVRTELEATDLDAVWAEWAATNPCKPGKKTEDANGKKVRGPAGPSLVTDEERAKFKVSHKVAISIASARKAAGKMPAEFAYTPMTAEQKAAAKAIRVAAKAASGTESATESATESVAEKPKKERKPRAPKVAPKPVVAPPPPPPPTEDEEDVEMVEWSFKNRNYLIVVHESNDDGEPIDADCWVRNTDGNPGKWAGHWNGSKIDSAAVEPK